MPKTKIDFRVLETIPQLIKDFLNQELQMYRDLTFSLENILEKTEAKKESFQKSQREILQKTLHQQYSGVTLSAKQQENVALLSQENCFTIVTGHQLNLFTGPVFFIYKILQTIKTAQFLNEHCNEKFVPIFWLASEDHDFEEINYFKTENNFYEIKAKSGGAVGKIAIEDIRFIDEFEKEFKDDVFGTELIKYLKETYKKGKTLAEATKTIVQYLFSEYGLLTIDGDDVALKQQMTDIFREELTHQIVKNKTKETVDFLTEKYGKVQVNPREVNLFYLSETRNRIDFDGEQFQIIDKNLTFTLEELTSEIEKISPNALLRPVYQEKILPNVAYIGGNAEIMYWLELIEVFKYFNIPFPVLIPRNSLVFLKKKTLHKIEKSSFLVEDYFGNFQNKINQNLLKESSLSKIIEETEQLIANQFLVFKNKAEETDKTFRSLVEAEEKRQLKSYSRMKKRLLRAEKIKHADRITFLQNLYLEINPSGIWQERTLNFSNFYAEEGASWLRNCYQEIDVCNSVLIVIEN